MRLAGAVLLAALLTGCGGTAASLDDAAEATAADTSRFEMQFRVTGVPGGSFTMTAEGVFDYPNERGLMTVGGEMPDLEEDVTFTEFRLLGKVGYTRWVVKGESHWVKDDRPEASGDPVELLIPFPGSPTKPTDVLARVVLASDEEEELGDEEIRGTETTHYRARVDVQKLIKQLPAKDRPDGDVPDFWGDKLVPVEIWIDDQSRLRRISIDQSDGEDATMSTTVELFDYGVEVDVEPPPADEVISQDEFEKLTGSMGVVTEESGELSLEEACKDAREHLPKKDADEICSALEEKE
jgi:LppX_LprAFG lipoprotein